jgi:hypothetical protein
MSATQQLVETPPQTAPAPPAPHKGRLIELDILRGFLLLWMTLTHLPTRVSVIANQTFGFVSGAEGFIFLAAFMMGQIEYRLEEKRGRGATIRDVFRRTGRIYLYHCGLLAIAFTLVAAIGVDFHRLALQNLLAYYLQQPKQAILSAILLEYRPSLLDILPMYIVFMLLTPLARWIADRWSWKPVLAISVAVWAAAQFGIRAWLYGKHDIFGLSVPENSTGSFDLYGWQLIWMAGLALGGTVSVRPNLLQFPRWVVTLSCVVAAIFLVLRYSPIDHWTTPATYGWLIDKWHLGAVRIIDFAAIVVVLVRFGAWIARLPFFTPLASLGQTSLEVFCVHILFCIGGVALNPDADPILAVWQQAILVPVTVAALFLTAQIGKKRIERKLAAS